MNVRKWHHSEIRIAINDESQGSIATNLKCDELLYYTFIIYSAGERIFNIGEHLAKLQAKWLTCVSCGRSLMHPRLHGSIGPSQVAVRTDTQTVSYAQFALHFCSQRCRSRQISRITCVLQTETVIKRCYVNRQITVS